MAMDKKESAAAANALIGWFNSQSINSKDSELVMLRVMAVLIDKRLPKITMQNEAEVQKLFRSELDEHDRVLAHELIDRLFHTRGRNAK